MTSTETIPTEWTQESVAALIVVPLLAIAFLAVGVLCSRKAKALERELRKRGGGYTYSSGMDDFDRKSFAIGAGVCYGAVLICAFGLWWGMYPWKAEYHQWRPVSGVVDTVDSRLLPAGETSMEQKFVVAFKGNPQQYGVLDTRAAGVKPGDRLTITCVRRWQWSGAHGFDCNFVELERAR